jgi:hypothetical protein
MIQGACLCGVVRYEFAQAFETMQHCHCSMCRKHHGSAFATFVSSRLDAFRWLNGHARVAAYASSPNGRRCFCTVCGSVVPLVLEDEGIVFAPAGNLEGDLGVRPQAHVFVGSKAPWYTIVDGLPQFERFPPGDRSPVIERLEVQSKPGIVQGSCLCGDIAFEIEGSPVLARQCHGARCRRAYSAAHSASAVYRQAQLHWLRGAKLVCDYKLPNARRFSSAFCAQCGSAAPRLSVEPSLAVVPMGLFDTDPGFRPEAHVFVGAKASWFDITDDLPQYRELPEDG